MEEFKKEVNKLNNDEQFKYFLTDEEDGENLYESGLIIAKNEGLEEGIVQGIQEGSKEASITISKNLLKNTDMTLEEVSLTTGVPLEEIKMLV